MCGRFVTVIQAAELKAIFDLIERPQTEPRYNVAPTQNVGVIRQADDSVSHYDQLKWGLVTSWSIDSSKGALLINARSETVAEKPSFRHAIKKNRCIIPVSGFYEWSHVGTEKHGTPLGTFSILTTAANKLISALHDRMPVILQADNHKI